MKYIYDFSLEVPAPTLIIDKFNEVINRHAQLVWENGTLLLLPSNDDEGEIMGVLFGIGRLVEVNVRIAWETFANQEGLDEDASPRKYIDILKCIDKYIENNTVHLVLNNALSITDGLVHGGFYQAYVQAQKAYEIEDLNLTQSKFIQQTITTTVLTSKGLNHHAKTGVTTATDGNPTSHKSFIPSKKNTIEDNFQSFYVAATFVPVYDVLLSSFYRANHYRKCISSAEKSDQS